MRRGLLILACGAVVAIFASYRFYIAGTSTQREWLDSRQPELAWLKHEFKLSDAEFTRISRLHEAYVPECQKRCRRIAALNDQLVSAISSTTQMTPQIDALLADRAQMRAECQAEMLRHFFEVSRTMPAEEARRYLAWVQKQTCLIEQPMSPD